MDQIEDLEEKNLEPDGFQNMSESEIEKFQNIKLKDLSTFFSYLTLQDLEGMGVFNLYQLFVMEECVDSYVNLESLRFYDEAIGTARLLKCEYLQEDPCIDINDEQMNPQELYKLLGFRAHVKRALLLENFCNNAKEYFEKMQQPDIKYTLSRMWHIGPKLIDEIMQKTNIVLNYNRIFNPKKALYEDTLTKLKQLRGELKDLNKQRNLVREEICQLKAQLSDLIDKEHHHVYKIKI